VGGQRLSLSGIKVDGAALRGKGGAGNVESSYKGR